MVAVVARAVIAVVVVPVVVPVVREVPVDSVEAVPLAAKNQLNFNFY